MENLPKYFTTDPTKKNDKVKVSIDKMLRAQDNLYSTRSIWKRVFSCRCRKREVLTATEKVERKIIKSVHSGTFSEHDLMRILDPDKSYRTYGEV